MSCTLRKARVADAPAVGSVCYEAFRSISDAHNFPADFPSADHAAGLLGMLIAHPGFYAVVAERDGKIIGSNFMDERSQIAGIGPISVDPSSQNAGAGRMLMDDAVARAMEHKAGVRLVQLAYHNRSLCLYTTVGFRTRQSLSIMQGNPLNISFPGYEVRAGCLEDLDACNKICREVHGFDRSTEVKEALGKSVVVVEHLGEITGYTTTLGFFGHTAAKTNQDLMALIGAASEFPGPGFLLPTQNFEVFSWCLKNRLRLVAQATLMTIGLYNEPTGAYLPSILY
jgi:predicted N-acetyltransferase YhbS